SDLVVILLISCAMLVYEILLTRVCALRLLFHYSFVVVGNCLLGLGAAGTVIFLNRERWSDDPGARIAKGCAAFLVALIAAYVFVLTFPVWPEQASAKPPDLLRVAFFNLVVAVPFFFAGLVVGLLLTFNAHRVNRLYGLDLVGAAAGCAALP